MNDKIIPVCINLYKSDGKERSFQDRIYKTEEIAPAITTSFRPYFLIMGGDMNEEARIIEEEVIQKVRVRKYPVDELKLLTLLLEHKKYTNKEIAERLNIPVTKVEHWFRKDGCFAIPDPENWLKLKDLLNIETDEFDKAITEFEIKDSVYDKSNRCYDINGIAPTITATDKGVMIKEVIKVGNVVGKGRSQGGRVYDPRGLSPTLISGMDHSNTMPFILEGGNMNEEITCTPIGRMEGSYESMNRVYSVEGLSPTLNACGGGNLQPKILVKEDMETIKNEQPTEDLILIGGLQKHQAVKKDGISTALTSAMGDGGGNIPLLFSNYRIRKLIPLECFRLMGVTDEDANKMLAVNSNSQCYKQAGNSIVVDVMAAMFKKLF